MGPLMRFLILIAGLALCLPATAVQPVIIEPLDVARPESGLRIAFSFSQPPDYHLRHHEQRIVLQFKNIEREQLEAMLNNSALDHHPLIRRWGVVQPAGQLPALVLELTSPTIPRLSVTPDEHGYQLRMDLPAKPVQVQADSAGGINDGLRAIRFGRRNGGLRLVIETNQAVPFQLISQSPSDQVQLRLVGMEPSTLEAALREQLPAHQDLIDQIMINGGEAAQATLQLNLHSASAITVFNLQADSDHGHRLVIDLEPVTTSRPPTIAVVEPAPGRRSAPQPERQAEPQPEPVTTELLWLEATLNQQRQRPTLLALKDNGSLYLTAADLELWHLKMPEHAHLRQHGEQWYALGTLGIEYQLDRRALTINMTAPTALFSGHAMNAPGRLRIAPTPSPLGAFLNYDVSVTRSGNDFGAGALLELGVFNGWGSGTSSAIVRHGSQVSGNTLVRLDTTWRRDQPDSRRTLILGDTLSRAAHWSGGVRYGGLQWGNNFDLQPELITLPLVSMAGEAALPSVIEVYINDALRLRQNVEPGPFDIDQIPVVTGPGQATLVVTDILGRQQILTQDFYASQRLLRQGLHDWTVDIGAIRENYGIEDFNYGRPFVAATHRHGFTNRLTGEFHGHLTQDHGAVGVGGNWLLPGSGVLSAASAISRGDQANGWFQSLGMQRQGRRFSVGVDSQFASAEFTRLGQSRPLPERQLRGHIGIRAFDRGSFGLSYTGQQFHDRDEIEFVTLRYSQRLNWAGYFSLSAVRYLDTAENALTATLSIPLSQPRTNVAFSASHRENATFGTVNLRRTPPAGTGYGYNLQVRAGDGEFQRAALTYQNDFGAWQAEGSHRNGQFTSRAQAAGGLSWLDGGWFFSRRIRDSFAVVQVPGFEGVRVYSENQEVARTNARGFALVPGLRPYQRNRLRIDPADLPTFAAASWLHFRFTARAMRSSVSTLKTVSHWLREQPFSMTAVKSGRSVIAARPS
jgi:outer membrane usher protein